MKQMNQIKTQYEGSNWSYATWNKDFLFDKHAYKF